MKKKLKTQNYPKKEKNYTNKMPYVSQAQAAYFHIHKKELESKGVDVSEWDESSKGKKLPEHKTKKKKSMAHHIKRYWED